jgi:chromate reductase
MATTPRIIAFAGSLRKDSFNKKLVNIAAAGARSAGAEVTVIDLREYPLPVFDQDLEASAGLPENAKKLKQIFIAHNAILISSPEYNSSITAVLKNTIDWISRPEPNEPSLAAYQKKVAAIMSASPGALGGLRGLVHLRSILSNIGVLVLPGQISVNNAGDAFNPDGSLKDAKQQASAGGLGKQLVETTAKLLA